MEFALEMVAKASLLGMNVAEVPTTLSQDHRARTPHLRTWRDGRRSLRSYILFSPNWLFLYPGLLLMLIGTVAGAWILSTRAAIGAVHFSVHSLMYCALAILLGLQAACFSLFTRMIAVSGHFTPPDLMLERLVKSLRSYHGLATGATFIGVGCAGSIYTLTTW